MCFQQYFKKTDEVIRCLNFVLDGIDDDVSNK